MSKIFHDLKKVKLVTFQVTKGSVKLDADADNIDYGDFPNFDYVSDDAVSALRSK